MNRKGCIILAAGDGTRMKSHKPKVLMEVMFEPMLGWVLDAAEGAGITEIGIVLGNGVELVKSYLDTRKKSCRTYMQTERKGTGHAVMQAAELLGECEDVLVLCGDAPFMDSYTIMRAYEQHVSQKNDVTVITTALGDPTGYGRILRGEDGKLTEIVEEKDCSSSEKNIREINSGAYWFKAARLAEALPKLETNNANGEYYLTDTVGLLSAAAGAYKTGNSKVALGANSRKNLYYLNIQATADINSAHLDNGVEMVGTGQIIGKDVKIGMDTVIMPNTIIKGNTVIGEGCVIGPNSIIENCTIGDDVKLNNVQAYSSEIESGAKAGPFVHLRPGTKLHSGVKIGDFVEVKNSEIGLNTAIAHLTYIGDSDVGKGVNFGCGCVTANYDGVEKFRTKIGDNAFIGCNTNLIAPVEVGDNATTAAGSTITKNVPADSLAVERGIQKNIENWEKNKKRIKKA